MAHVRLASNKTTISKENSHPFSGKRIVLAHNGKLEPKDIKDVDKTKVDSCLFLEKFEEFWEDKSDLELPDALSKFMEGWEGKFAFIIYDLVTKKYYIVRGESADLHWAKVNGKLVVNTNKKDLDLGLTMLSQLNQILNKTTLEISEIKEVEKNTISLFDPKESSLINVGIIKENKINWTNAFYGGSWETLESGVQVWGYNPVGTKIAKDTMSDELTTLDRFMVKTLFTIEELEMLCFVTMGGSLIELSADSWQLFYKTILKTLEDKPSTRQKRIWKKFKTALLVEKAYENGLNFPWMLNSKVVLENLFEKLNNKSGESNDTKL